MRKLRSEVNASKRVVPTEILAPQRAESGHDRETSGEGDQISALRRAHSRNPHERLDDDPMDKEREETIGADERQDP